MTCRCSEKGNQRNWSTMPLNMMMVCLQCDIRRPHQATYSLLQSINSKALMTAIGICGWNSLRWSSENGNLRNDHPAGKITANSESAAIISAHSSSVALQSNSAICGPRVASPTKRRSRSISCLQSDAFVFFKQQLSVGHVVDRIDVGACQSRSFVQFASRGYGFLHGNQSFF